jgi:hypothetical protein
MMEEIWKDIKGFEGRYQVSNLGRVRSLDWHGHKGRMLKLKINKMWGYYKLNLAHPDGYIKTVSVHRIVAIAFIPNPDNLPEVNHKDENKLNNVVCFNSDGSIDTERTNLEWCTGLYNIRYGTRNERIQKLVNEPRMRPVNQYDFDGELINTYPSIAEASKAIGVSTRTMTAICGKIGAHSTHGYVFRYADDNSPWVSYDPRLCRGNNERKRSIDQFDLSGNLVRSYESISKTSKETNISTRAIWSVLSHKQKTTHGFIFRYSDSNK